MPIQAILENLQTIQSSTLMNDQKIQTLLSLAKLLNYELIREIEKGEIKSHQMHIIISCIQYFDPRAVATAMCAGSWSFKDIEAFHNTLSSSQQNSFLEGVSQEVSLYFKRKAQNLEPFTEGEVSSLDILTFGSQELITQRQFREKILPNLPSNMVLFETDPAYSQEKRRKILPNDFIVFLIGPTNHNAVTSQWRIQVTKNISENKRIRDLLANYPENQLVFINPQYSNKPSKGFRGHGDDQIRWEKYYLDHTDLSVMYEDLRFKNPDGTTGNVGITVRKEIGSQLEKSKHGINSTITYTPKNSVGIDWTMMSDGNVSLFFEEPKFLWR